MEVGDAFLRTLPSKAVGGDAPNPLSDGVGLVFLDAGILGDVVAKVGSAEVERVRGVGPEIWECGFPSGECYPRYGTRDRADKGEVVGACPVVVEALSPSRAEELAGAWFGVVPEVDPTFDRFRCDS